MVLWSCGALTEEASTEAVLRRNTRGVSTGTHWWLHVVYQHEFKHVVCTARGHKKRETEKGGVGKGQQGGMGKREKDDNGPGVGGFRV